MFYDYEDAINKGLIEVKSVGLTELQGKVNQILRYRDFLDLLKGSRLYHPEPKYWVGLILNEEN